MSKDYRTYATKEITPTMDAFADWILDEVFAGELPEDVSDESFRKSVALAGSLRMEFQRSDFWKSDPRNYLNGVESRREAKAAEEVERAKASAKKQADRVKAAEARLVAAQKAAAAKEAKAEEAAA
jgi:hypothetical protein